MITFWYVWLVFILLVVIPPVGYGAYRGWGPPFPRYVQRRRGAQARAGDAVLVDQLAWGWAGDFIWLLLLVGFVWAAWGLLWRA